jgi:hypothetical protein
MYGPIFPYRVHSDLSGAPRGMNSCTYSSNSDIKENQIFLIYKEIQNGAVGKSYMRKGFLLYEEMRKKFSHL